MPPFKAGLLKRKMDIPDSDKSSSKDASSEEDSSDDNEELFDGDLDGEGDTTDSEPAEEAENSDGERDEVLYDDGVDSMNEVSSDSSTSLSEGDLSDVYDPVIGDGRLLSSSGDESGIGQTQSNSSGEEEKDEEDSDIESDNDKRNKGQKLDHKGTKLKTKHKKPIVAFNGAKDDSDINDNDTDDQVSELSHTDDDNQEKPNPQRKQKAKKVDKTSAKDKKTTKNSVDVLADKIKETSVNIQPVEEKDEYESGDTSDEEDRRNTVGEVPAWWYNEYPHVGYDLDGRRILRPSQRDRIDDFLKQCEDPDFWRTVRDPTTGQDIVLSKQDLELIARIRQGQVPNAEHDEYKPWIEWFTREVLATPIRSFPEHKRSFLPSRSEQQQISRIVHALKMGWTKTRKQIADERRKKKERVFYNLWGSTDKDEEEKLRGIHKHIPAPKRPLPSHAESYNPPPEYLLDAKEMKEWNKLSETPWKRKYTFLPTKYSSLRAVPAYDRFTRERFLRCLDLYLAPRAIKMRLTISPEDLVPKLPSPRELQPFPTTEALCLKGHANLVRSVDFDPSGQYIVSGSDDGFVKVWETSTGRCLRSIELGESVTRVAWTPATGLSLIAAAAGNKLLLLNPGADIGCHRVADRTDELLEEPPPQHDIVMDERTSAVVQWQKVSPEDWARGVRIQVQHFRPITHVAWHAKGDYIAVTLRDAAARAVLVHQISRRRSQIPFSRSKGIVQCALFHPIRAMLFVATQRVVRVYDLIKQELVRKLLTGAQWISSLAIHPAGDNLLVTSYDRKCMWFDLELSSKPYQTLRLHGGAVRAACFHARYPLLATAGDDPYIVVTHGMVYNDLLQNPLIVPLKQLKGPEKRADLCVTDVRFHPTQPWLLAAGADNTIRLYS